MFRRLALASVVVLLTCACSEPPTKERQQAEAGLVAARAAEAATYAPADLQAAEAALQKYDEAVAQRDYRQALNLAQEARDRAYDATTHATSEKTAARGLAEKLVAELDALSKAASARLAGAGPPGPRLTSQAAERLRAALRAAPGVLQEARALLDQRDYRGATLRLTPAVEALRREIPVSETAPARRGRRGVS